MHNKNKKFERLQASLKRQQVVHWSSNPDEFGVHAIALETHPQLRRSLVLQTISSTVILMPRVCGCGFQVFFPVWSYVCMCLHTQPGDICGGPFSPIETKLF
jgi:hypothetical protein